MWATLSTLAALAVVAGACVFVNGWKVVPATEDAAPSGFKRILYNKWYVDELYDRIVVQPLLAASRFAWKVIDAGIVDGIVNGVGNLAKALGWFGSLFQTGVVNTYAFILAIGVIAILGYVIL